MTSRVKDSIARQLRRPSKGVLGWIVTQLVFKSKNDYIERNAARLCGIKPDHKVLEVGFGPGIGLQHAVQYVKDGQGKIYGVDISPYMVEKASALLRSQILNKKVELNLGSVMDLPFATNTFDCVYHCNCYYFWPSMQDALHELQRVMKPGAIMVTAMNLKSVQQVSAKGLMKYGHPDPVKYMCALELSGFKDVKLEYFKDGSRPYEAILAHAPLQPEVENDISKQGEDLERS